MTDTEVYAIIDKMLPVLPAPMRQRLAEPGSVLFEKVFAIVLEDTVDLDPEIEDMLTGRWTRK